MSGPQRQHFIPRSYLNNFAEQQEEDKYFIGAAHKDKKEVKLFSTKDICVERNLYTLPIQDETKKFDLEHFYADKIDAVFPDIAAILKDKDIDSIDFETRLKIISVSLSLYFRTPKFLNAENTFFEQLVKEAAQSEGEFIDVEFSGKAYHIERKEIQGFVKSWKEENRVGFLSEHLRAYEKLIAAKLKNKITVYHITDESEFIISDNPVIIRPFVDPTQPGYDAEEYARRIVDPFDPSNMIHLPIDSKTILTILPEDGDEYYDRLHRIKIGLVDTILYNSDQEKQAERWIMGSMKGVEAHFANMEKYNKDTPENGKMIGDYQNRTLEIKELIDILETHGANSDQVKLKIKEMKTKDYNLSDPNFKHLADRLG